MPLPVSPSAVIPIRACAIPIHYNMTDTREVWLELGNVVVIAQNIAFRVYKQDLMDCSEVFRARLSTIDESTQQLGGCPAITVEGDPADLRHLFLVLFRRKKYVQVSISFVSPY